MSFDDKAMIDKTAPSGMSEEEKEVHDLLMEVWEKFNKLSRRHPDELKDFYRAIHVQQRLLAIRITAREYPKFWKTGNMEV